MHTSPSGMSYIGKSLSSKGKRWKEHIAAAYDEKYKEYNYPLQRAIRKYGEENFTSVMLEDEVPIELLSELEILYIEKYDTFYKGYNQTKGGEGTTGERSPEARECIAKANRERVWTEEMKERMRQAKSGVNGSRFIPWFIEYPNGSREEYFDKDKAVVALENNWHIGSFKNLFSKVRGVGKVIERGRFRGFRVGNIGETYE
jgi:group I intron endonuclease